MWLKQSTTTTLQVGPFLDKTDGVSPEVGLTPAAEISKGGAAFAARNSATAVAHDAEGFYRIELDATDTNTLGRLKLKAIDSANHVPVFHDFMILAANVWDSFFGADVLQTHVVEFTADVIDATAIAANAIGASELATDAIGDAQIATGAIASTAFVAGAINAAAIATDAITAAKIAANAIGASELATDAIGAAQISLSGVSRIRKIGTGVATSGSSTTLTDTSRAETDTDYWKGSYLLITNGDLDGQIRLITAYNFSTDTFTVDRAFTQNIITHAYDILPGASAELLVATQASIDAIEADTDELQGDDVPTLISTLNNFDPATEAVANVTLVATTTTNTDMVAEAPNAAAINAEVVTALAAINLDHLVGTATAIPAIVSGTYIDQMMDDGTATFDRTTDSLQAQRDDTPTISQFDARTLVAGNYFVASSDTVANVTTVASVSGAVGSVAGNVDGVVTGSLLATNTSTSAGTDVTLVDTSRTEADDVWNGSWLRMTGGGAVGQVRLITDFDAATDTITVVPAFTVATGSGSAYEILSAGGSNVELWRTVQPNSLAAGRVDVRVGNLSTDVINSNATDADFLVDIKTQATTALSDINLDHLMAVAAVGGDVVNSSIIARLTSKSATPAFADFVNTTDSLQAQRDNVGTAVGADISADVADIPTVSEFDARTLVAASYFDPALDTVATVTTLTGHTVQTGDSFARIGAAGVSLTDLGGMATAMKAEVNAEVLDVLQTDTFAEVGQEVPASTQSILKMVQYLYKAWRNRSNQTATLYQLFNDDASTVDQKVTVSDDATTFESGEVGTGP